MFLSSWCATSLITKKFRREISSCTDTRVRITQRERSTRESIRDQVMKSSRSRSTWDQLEWFPFSLRIRLIQPSMTKSGFSRDLRRRRSRGQTVREEMMYRMSRKTRRRKESLSLISTIISGLSQMEDLNLFPSGLLRLKILENFTSLPLRMEPKTQLRNSTSFTG